MSSALIMALAPSVVGNAAALGLGFAHGKGGDMPRLGAKKDEKGNPILDKDGNQQGGVPYDAITAGVGYGAAVGMSLLMKKGNARDIGTQVALRVGDAGSYIYTYSWGGQMGQKSRKDGGKTTSVPNARTIAAGQDGKREIAEGIRAAEVTNVADPSAELSRLYGIRTV